MRNKLLLVLLLLSGFITVYAQEYSPFQFGVKAGGNLYSTAMNIEDIAAKKLKIGYQVGLTGEYEFSESFYLQSGLFFVTKGVRIKGSGESSHWSQSIGLQYLQLPVLATYKIELIEDTKIFFNAGPYVAYGIRGKSSRKDRFIDSTRADEKGKLDSFGDNRMKRFDFGLKYSIGMEFEKFLFEWSYELGLKDIEEKNNEISPIFDNKHFKNQGLSLSVGYKF